jgi:hypothetical protein
MKEYEFHEAADIFPLMEGPEFQTLVEDIRANGLRERIWTQEGQILDGRNRYRACLEADVKPDFREWKGPGDPIAFVISMNMHRRHLNESQRAMVADKVAQLRKGQKKADAPIGASDATQVEAAKLVNVSRRSVQRAHKLRKDGAPQTVEAAENGSLSLHGGLALAKERPEEQERILSLSQKERNEELKLKRTKSKKRVEQEQQEVVSHVETDTQGENMKNQWRTALDLLLTIIQKARTDKWSDLPLRVVTEGLAKLNAAMCEEPILSPDAPTLADDYADSVQDVFDEVNREPEVLLTVDAAPLGEINPAEALAPEEMSEEIQEGDADEQQAPVEGVVSADAAMETIVESEGVIGSEIDPDEIEPTEDAAMDGAHEEVDDTDEEQQLVEDAEGLSVGRPSCFGQMWVHGKDCKDSEGCDHV